MVEDLYVIKKDGTKNKFNDQKILAAISKSADRVMVTLSEKDKELVLRNVKKHIDKLSTHHLEVSTLHNIVELSLEKINPLVAKSYREYRNYKIDFVKMLDEVYQKAQSIRYLGDKENSNTDSTIVATKRSLTYNELNKELYNKFFLTTEEKQACKDGYIYIHDKSARLDTINCSLFDVKSVMTNGFEMGNMWYEEPNSVDTACDVLGDIIMNSASNQYGGWSARVDDLLESYVEKSFIKLKQDIVNEILECTEVDIKDINMDKVENKAYSKTYRELEQGIQGLEYKLNSVASSRGDYPFVSFSFGLSLSKFGQMVSEVILKVRMEGQGKKGKKKSVLFPKLIFLYDEDLHGVGKPLEHIFNIGVECNKKAMYPDYLSLTGNSYVADIYKKYGLVITPMGCRAFLSPYYKNGGMYPQDKNDKPVFTGRFNIGAVTLHLPMIYQKSKNENKEFFDVLDYYLNMARQIHIRTYEYLGHMKASTNPLAYCEGGFYGGNLNPNDRIKPLLKSATASFGITALNELQELYNGKSLVDDGDFAIEVMEYINKKINEFKEEDHNLYAIYGTPAESLCGLQITQFRNKYGTIKNVSDKPYTTNSFHCHVTENITPVEKQDLEYRFWNLFNGGKIQYVKYPIDYNTDAIKTLVRRAMNMGLYEGINLSLAYCEDCGHEEKNMEICPVCGGENLTKIERMNGYLSYSRVKGDTRLNDAKMAEIKDRVSM